MNEVLQYWPVGAYIGFILLIALMWAEDDARTIAAHKPIHHKKAWMWRAYGAFMPTAYVAPALGSWWCILPLLVLGAFLFSAVFRYRLNKLRGLHACYVSPSNHYDWLFIRVHRFGLDRIGGRWIVTEDEDWYSIADFYKNHRTLVHRAGRLCYLTEITLSVLSIVVLGKMMKP